MVRFCRRGAPRAAPVGLAALPSSAHAGAWTTEEGVVWSKLALFHLRSDRIFVDSIRAGTFCGDRTLELGERAPYDCQLEAGGGLITTQLFLETAIGLHERVDLRLQVPMVLQGRFDSSFVGENEQGLGDIRFGGQVRALADPIVLSAGWEVKAPTGEFVTDAVRIPLGEGQWDLTLRTLLARSFLEGRVWAGGELGYRIRFDNDQADLEVGDELVGVVETSARPLPWLYLQWRGDLLWGFPSQRVGGPIVQELAPRRVMVLQPSLVLNPLSGSKGPFESFGVEWGVRVPVWGQGWPADPIWFVALSQSFRGFESYSRPDP